MQTNELIERKRQLEADITELIKQFINDTDLDGIVDIKVELNHIFNKPYYSVDTHVNVKVSFVL